MLICECLIKVNYFAKLKVDVIQAFGNMALAVFVPYHHILRAARLRSREENGPRTRIILQVQIRRAGLVRHTEYSRTLDAASVAVKIPFFLYLRTYAILMQKILTRSIQ